MRPYYFFMKFMRSFGIGLLCGFTAIFLIAAIIMIFYNVIFI